MNFRDFLRNGERSNDSVDTDQQIDQQTDTSEESIDTDQQTNQQSTDED